MNRNNNYTMIHMVGAVMVIIGHMYDLLGSYPPVIMGIDVHGLGVRILFLTSGFLGSQSYLRSLRSHGRIRNYFVKRFFRLYPSLIACLLLSIFVLHWITETPEYYWQWALRYFLNNIEMRPKFDLPGVFTQNIYPVAVNGSLWTLPIEIACYILLIPIMETYRVVKNKKAFGMGFLALLIAFSIVVAYSNRIFADRMLVVWDTNWIGALNLILWFFLGIMYTVVDIRRFLNWQIAALLVIPFMCTNGNIRILFSSYLISYLVFCFGEAQPPRFARTFKADLCYGLYLYSFPVQQLLVYAIKVRRGYDLSIYVYILAAITITAILATVNYLCVEKPASWLLKRITGKTGAVK